MWGWVLRKGASALSQLPCLALLLWVSCLSVTCHDLGRGLLSPRVANGSVPVVGRHARSYPHLEGDVRLRRLLCVTNYFLKIDADGKVGGTTKEDCPYSVLEITSVDVGIVAVRGVESKYFLAMNEKGKVYGSFTLVHSKHDGVSMATTARDKVPTEAAGGLRFIIATPVSTSPRKTLQEPRCGCWSCLP
ncbi:fibroblast growth factor 10 isoform X3 [Pleurodeles waltl]|uniref:fibroblast growth factor 10 isoform X3 n=1 Tax=Pleurodeles waltl TaxID=8319 RepID=UPI003709BB1E